MLASTFQSSASRKGIAAAVLLLVAIFFQDVCGFLYTSWQQPEYSYGVLIPVLAAVLVWRRWPDIGRRAGKNGGWIGIAAIAAGLLLLAGATLLESLALSVYALVVVIGGGLLLLCGWTSFRMVCAPLLLLFLMGPLPEAVHGVLSDAMQRTSARIGVALLQGLGRSAHFDGQLLDMGTFRLTLQSGDYGLGYLLPLFTLAVIMAFFVRVHSWIKVAVVLSTLPIAAVLSGLHFALWATFGIGEGNVVARSFPALVEGWAGFMAGALLLVVEAWLLSRFTAAPRRLRDVLTIDWPEVQSVSRRGDDAATEGSRLLLVTSNFAPEVTGIGKYAGEMAEWMAAAGFEVRVVTAPPYYPAWRIASEYAGGYRVENIGGARVYRCPLWVPRQPRGLTRILHTLTFSLSTLPVILWQALTWRPHLVFVIEPPLACAPASRLAATLSGARSWLHVQDFEVDAAFELGLVRGEIARKVAAALERRLMRQFDVVSTISPRMLARLLRKGIERTRCVYFPNWVDTNLIAPGARLNSLRTELAIPDHVRVVLYSGNMGKKQGLEMLVEVTARFAGRRDVLFLLCGEGVAKDELVQAMAGFTNVRFMPLQPLARLNELLAMADVHLLPQRAGAEDLVMPSKLTAIMASGRPVVASARRGTELARAAEKGGLVTPPGDSAAFAAALARLLDDAQLHTVLSQRAREHAVASWDKATILRRAQTEVTSMLSAERGLVLAERAVRS